MKNRPWLIAVVFTMATSTADALADLPLPLHVGQLGDPSTFSFDGVQSWAIDDLVAALEDDIVFQVAARPESHFPKLLVTVAERLMLGYQHTGFLHAKVSA